MKKIIIMTGALLGLSLVSCQKKSCDNAYACMVNNTGDTVRYSWNSNARDNILLPGDSTCHYAGEMDWNTSYSSMFESDHGNYAVDIEDCEQTYYID